LVKVVVCGGRSFTDTEFIYRELDRLHKELQISTLIEGDAAGVDRIAGYWARRNKITNKKFFADWHKDGRAAGFIRNLLMLAQNPDYVIVFPGGNGTAHTRKNAIAKGLNVIDIGHEPMV